MQPKTILAKAEAWKRKAHRLSLDLRLRSVSDARKFVREQGVVLWNAKAELPNLADAIIGRVANSAERVHGKPAETCHQWRGQILQDSEFLECKFFRNLTTVLHQDLWPYASVIATANREQASKDVMLSKDARRILHYLDLEGATRSDALRKALKYTAPAEMRTFHKAKRELQSALLVLGKEDKDSKSHTHTEILTLWNQSLPRTVLNRADQLSPEEASWNLLSATLQSCILSPEKSIPRWFRWNRISLSKLLDRLRQSREFVRVDYRRQVWIVPRKLLSPQK